MKSDMLRQLIRRAADAVAFCVVAFLAGCATTVDLRDDFREAAPRALQTHLSCDDISDLECQCRREGLERRLPRPSPGEFDSAYKMLLAAREEGTPDEVARGEVGGHEADELVGQGLQGLLGGGGHLLGGGEVV